MNKAFLHSFRERTLRKCCRMTSYAAKLHDPLEVDNDVVEE